jgi:tRNA (guanine-N7-)-methyltransferase
MLVELVVMGYNAPLMKPKDLKPPFSWKSRRVVWEDKLLFVPERIEYTEAEPLTFAGPVYIEYCSGNGDWIIEKALANPDVEWIAIEKRFDRVRKIWSKRENHSIKNLTIACGMAQTITTHFLVEGSIERIYINFPDPWPKDRHAKHRIFQGPFIEDMARVLKPGGRLIAATDDAPYSEQIAHEVLQSNHFTSLFDPPIQTDWPAYGDSYFHDLWRELGRTIHFFNFERGE